MKQMKNMEMSRVSSEGSAVPITSYNRRSHFMELWKYVCIVLREVEGYYHKSFLCVR